MPAVSNTIVLPGGAAAASASVSISLVTGSVNGPGFLASSAIEGATVVTADANGLWTATLVANALISPANTAYRVVECNTAGEIIGGPYYITVPNGAGPYVVSNILTTAPASLVPPGAIASSVLTVDGDILTRAAGVPARITRAQLAADAAFSGTYVHTTINPLGGVLDDSAQIVAAMTALPTTGGTITFGAGIYNGANMTIPNRQGIVLDFSSGAVIKKNANGPVFTTPGGGWGQNLTFIEPHIDCNGGNFTGHGIDVGASSTYMRLVGGYVIDATGNPLRFGVAGGGSQCDVDGTLLTVWLGQAAQANATVAAIYLPLDTGAPNRGFRGVRTNGCLLFEDNGSQDTRFADCEARNINIVADPGKLFVTGCRLSSIGADINIRGTQVVFANNAVAGSLKGGATLSNSTVAGNVIAGDFILAAGSSGNACAGNRPSTGVTTDSGTGNIVVELIALAAIPLTQKAAASGVASLDASGNVVQAPKTHDLRGGRHTDLLKPTGCIAETIRRAGGGFADSAPLTSGRVMLQAIVLPAGPVTSITWAAGPVGLTRGTNADSHLWYVLCDSTFTILRSTADDTSGAFAANSLVAKNLSAPYTVTAEGLFYVGIMVNIGTGGAPALPQLLCALAGNANIAGQTPRICANFDGSLTVPPADGFVFTVSAGQSAAHYALVS